MTALAAAVQQVDRIDRRACRRWAEHHASRAALAERVRKTLETHDFVYGDKVLKKTVSMGVSENQAAFNIYQDLLDDADRKLYQSKHSGRNRVTV